MKGRFYKEKGYVNSSMLLGDQKGSPDESINSNLNQDDFINAPLEIGENKK